MTHRPRPTAPRLAPLSEAEWDEQTRAILAPLTQSGSVLNIFGTLARHPLLLKRWLVFGTHVLAQSTLPARERELVILRIGWLCRAEYEWGQHAAIGRLCGLTDDEIRRIPKGADDPAWSPADALLLRATDELHADACLSDATWKALAASYGEQQIIDLIFAVGQYNLVSMALNSLGVQREAGVEGFPE